MAAIHFERVTKYFGETPVLTDLDLTIEDGEFFTFVGPSGCGKSTLLHLIAGIESVTGGALYFDDQPVDALAPAARDVAMVFQSYALYPHMTVAENLAFPLKNKRVPKATIAAEVERVARTLGLEALLRRRPKELSGGQRQRVALGRALIRRPRVFLMDEPLSNLDARLRLEMREELKRLHEVTGTTTVYVTHDQEEAMALSQRLAVLESGTMRQCGTPDEVYRAPANLFVAQFIGSPPMNLFAPQVLRALPAIAPGITRFGDRELVLGVRPADIRVFAQHGENRLEVLARLLEPTGSDVWIVGEFQGQRMKGRVAADEPMAPGAPAFFEFPHEKIYAFDAKSGMSLGKL